MQFDNIWVFKDLKNLYLSEACHRKLQILTKEIPKLKMSVDDLEGESCHRC